MKNNLAIRCQKESVVASWHFVAEILKKNVETEPAPSHVKNGMFNVKKRKYGKRTIKVEIGKIPRIVATLRAASK